MKGTINCNKCGSVMDEETGLCPRCKKSACLVKLPYKGEKYRYRRGFNQKVFNVITARKFLDYLRSEADRLGLDFSPEDYLDAKIKDRIFIKQFEKWILEKEKEVARGKRSPEYIRVLKSYNRKWYVRFENKDVKDITKATIKEFANEITTKSKTAKNILDGLRTFFNWMHDSGIIENVPAFPVMEVDDAQVKWALSIEVQAEQLLLIPEMHRDIFEFETETGLRPGEACALKVKDLDIAEAVALIQRTFSGKYERDKTKQKRKYLIPLSERAVELAAKHIQGKTPEAFLFINPVTGRHYTRHTLGDYWNKYTTAGICHYDGTRHSFCTQLVDAGVNPFHAKDLMRQSSLKSTERYYHGNIKILRSALDKRTKVTQIDEARRPKVGPSISDS